VRTLQISHRAPAPVRGAIGTIPERRSGERHSRNDENPASVSPPGPRPPAAALRLSPSITRTGPTADPSSCRSVQRVEWRRRNRAVDGAGRPCQRIPGFGRGLADHPVRVEVHLPVMRPVAPCRCRYLSAPASSVSIPGTALATCAKSSALTGHTGIRRDSGISSSLDRCRAESPRNVADLSGARRGRAWRVPDALPTVSSEGRSRCRLRWRCGGVDCANGRSAAGSLRGSEAVADVEHSAGEIFGAAG
jgi:hypothetical protein